MAWTQVALQNLDSETTGATPSWVHPQTGVTWTVSTENPVSGTKTLKANAAFSSLDIALIDGISSTLEMQIEHASIQLDNPYLGDRLKIYSHVLRCNYTSPTVNTYYLVEVLPRIITGFTDINIFSVINGVRTAIGGDRLFFTQPVLGETWVLRSSVSQAAGVDTVSVWWEKDSISGSPRLTATNSTNLPPAGVPGFIFIDPGSSSGSVGIPTIDNIKLFSAPVAPTVSSQPASISRTQPATASFTAVVSGVYDTLQWQRSTDGGGAWSDLSGETGLTYSAGATSLGMNGYKYRLKINWTSSTGAAVVYSSVATLSVNLGIAANPTSVAATAIDGTSVTVTWVNGSPPGDTYSVFLRTHAGPGAWVDKGSAVSSPFVATGASPATEYDVAVQAISSGGNSALVIGASTVTTDNTGTGGGGFGSYPSVSTNPLNQSVVDGQNVTFAAVFNGDTPITYTWETRVNSDSTPTVVSGATNASLTINSVSVGDSGKQYRASATNAVGGPIYTEWATLTVTAGIAAPTVLTNPNDATVVEGSTVNFSATFTGTAPVTLGWQTRASSISTTITDVPGELTSTLTVPSVSTSQSGSQYRAKATNAAGGPVYTSWATLVVSPAATGTGFPNLSIDMAGNLGLLFGAPNLPPSVATTKLGELLLLIGNGNLQYAVNKDGVVNILLTKKP